MDVLKAFFGADYVQRQAQRPGAALWHHDLCPLLGSDRVDRVMELAGRITAIRHQPRYHQLRHEASQDRQGSYFTHLQALLVIAAPLSDDGWAVDLAPRPLAGRRKQPDLRASREKVTFSVEVKHLGYDQNLKDTQRFHDRVSIARCSWRANWAEGWRSHVRRHVRMRNLMRGPNASGQRSRMVRISSKVRGAGRHRFFRTLKAVPSAG